VLGDVLQFGLVREAVIKERSGYKREEKRIALFPGTTVYRTLA